METFKYTYLEEIIRLQIIDMVQQRPEMPKFTLKLSLIQSKTFDNPQENRQQAIHNFYL